MFNFPRLILGLSAAGLILAGCSSFPAMTDKDNTAAAASEALQLTDTSWMMKLPKNSQCDVPPMIEFGEKQASGDMGCNRFTASYSVDGTKIQFDQVAATLRMCGPEYMKLEDQMQNLLNAARSAKQTKTALTFFDEDGKEILTLVPEEAGACE